MRISRDIGFYLVNKKCQKCTIPANKSELFTDATYPRTVTNGKTDRDVPLVLLTLCHY